MRRRGDLGRICGRDIPASWKESENTALHDGGVSSTSSKAEEFPTREKCTANVRFAAYAMLERRFGGVHGGRVLGVTRERI